jgi:hypothetical protein
VTTLKNPLVVVHTDRTVWSFFEGNAIVASIRHNHIDTMRADGRTRLDISCFKPGCESYISVVSDFQGAVNHLAASIANSLDSPSKRARPKRT